MGLLINPYLLDGGASISIGSANVVLAAEGNYLSLTRMDDTHVIMCYRDVVSQTGRAVCLTLSGTTITAEPSIVVEDYIGTVWIAGINTILLRNLP